MKRLFKFLCFILTIVFAIIAKRFTNEGVDLLVYTWVIGGGVVFLIDSIKAKYITFGIIIAACAYVLFQASNWDWRFLDYCVMIERLIAVIVTGGAILIQKSGFPIQ